MKEATNGNSRLKAYPEWLNIHNNGLDYAPEYSYSYTKNRLYDIYR